MSRRFSAWIEYSARDLSKYTVSGEARPPGLRVFYFVRVLFQPAQHVKEAFTSLFFAIQKRLIPQVTYFIEVR